VTLSFITPEKIKNPELKSLSQYYLKLISKFSQVQEHFIDSDESLVEWIEKRKKNKNIYVIILHEKGKLFSGSRDFANHLQKVIDSGISECVFILGGAHEFGKEVQALATLKWSLSSLTLAHEMAYVVTTEQIFRAFTILNRHPYHND
jgi:23S rRNA (pseudouridine1915-N3)-methyltransferase